MKTNIFYNNENKSNKKRSSFFISNLMKEAPLLKPASDKNDTIINDMMNLTSYLEKKQQKHNNINIINSNHFLNKEQNIHKNFDNHEEYYKNLFFKEREKNAFILQEFQKTKNQLMRKNDQILKKVEIIQNNNNNTKNQGFGNREDFAFNNGRDFDSLGKNNYLNTLNRQYVNQNNEKKLNFENKENINLMNKSNSNKNLLIEKSNFIFKQNNEDLKKNIYSNRNISNLKENFEKNEPKSEREILLRSSNIEILIEKKNDLQKKLNALEEKIQSKKGNEKEVKEKNFDNNKLELLEKKLVLQNINFEKKIEDLINKNNELEKKLQGNLEMKKKQKNPESSKIKALSEEESYLRYMNQQEILNSKIIEWEKKFNNIDNKQIEYCSSKKDLSYREKESEMTKNSNIRFRDRFQETTYFRPKTCEGNYKIVKLRDYENNVSNHQNQNYCENRRNEPRVFINRIYKPEQEKSRDNSITYRKENQSIPIKKTCYRIEHSSHKKNEDKYFPTRRNVYSNENKYAETSKYSFKDLIDRNIEEMKHDEIHTIISDEDKRYFYDEYYLRR